MYSILLSNIATVLFRVAKDWPHSSGNINFIYVFQKQTIYTVKNKGEKDASRKGNWDVTPIWKLP